MASQENVSMGQPPPFDPLWPNVFIGEIRPFAVPYAPEGWLLCDGTEYTISDFLDLQYLLAVIGYAFGGSEGTFAVPDLRSRLPVSAGRGLGLTPYTLAEEAGSEAAAITSDNLPAHSHDLYCNGGAPTSNTPVWNYPAAGQAYGTPPRTTPRDKMYATTPGQNTTMNVGAVVQSGVPASAMPVIQPCLALNYCICWSGIWPTRS